MTSNFTGTCVISSNGGQIAISNTEEVDNVEEEEILCTDVPASLEIELRKLLSQKLSKSAVYFGAGSVTQFEVSEEEKTETWSCYYCMLKDKEIREDGGNVKYIVCFLAPEAEMLEITFTQDLDVYCKKLSEEIRNVSKNIFNHVYIL
ncbi:hypothetical protein AM593_00286, partial [Mytilus galloprovincialis]